MAYLYHLDDQITNLKGIGEASAEKLSKLKIFTIRDLLHLIPTRYLDFSQKLKITELQEGSTACFLGTTHTIKSFFTKTGKQITETSVSDDTGKITLLWFHNPYIKKILQENTEYTIAGKVSKFNNKLVLVSPTVEEGNSLSLNTKGLVPIFPQTKGITSKWLRQKVYDLLANIKLQEPLNEKILNHQNLPDIQTAYTKIHFPQNKLEKKIADKRLSFNQHLQININNQINLRNLGASPKIKINQKITDQGLEKLPFKLTPDQDKTIKSLYKDLSTSEYTHRLIQGDTGSGKTATILMAANQCLANNQSCALLAPTVILAHQHFLTFQKLSLFPDQISFVSVDSKPEITNKPTLFIGTHALLEHLPQNLTPTLSFIAVDEQHKFGVKQRESLQQRVPVPHIINLSATPIPRTVALGLLGDIKISNIKYKPQNRLPIKTHVVSQSYFTKSTPWLNKHLNAGSQVYVVSPNISDHQNSVSSVESLQIKYAKNFPSTPLFVVHGKLKNQDQKSVLEQFKKTPGSILIATSLIEVGIDVPTANVMIIHSAERFGLAQLHQLRGRVGRGEKQSFCFLVPSTDDQVETERLSLLQKHNSGLVLAKKDLILRGAGEIFGDKQHGNLQTRLEYFWSKKSFLAAKKLAKSLISQSPKEAETIVRHLETC